MWIPEKLRNASKNPWLILAFVLTFALAIASILDAITKLKVKVDTVILAGIQPHGTAQQSVSFPLFAVLVGVVIAAIFFACLYLVTEWRRHEASNSLDERTTKAYKTLQGMMRAANRLRTQTFPPASGRLDNKSFDRIHLLYEIDQEFNCTVTRTYDIRAVQQPLHFWKQAFRVRSEAEPAEYLVDIGFKARDRSGCGEIVYLPTENDQRSKSVSLYFLPRLEVGAPARKIEISYRWKGMSKALKVLGEEPFEIRYNSIDPLAELVLEVYLQTGTGGVLRGEISGAYYPGASIIQKAHPDKADWTGFCYRVPNAPSGFQVSHSVIAKWRNS